MHPLAVQIGHYLRWISNSRINQFFANRKRRSSPESVNSALSKTINKKSGITIIDHNVFLISVIKSCVMALKIDQDRWFSTNQHEPWFTLACLSSLRADQFTHQVIDTPALVNQQCSCDTIRRNSLPNNVHAHMDSRGLTYKNMLHMLDKVFKWTDVTEAEEINEIVVHKHD